MSSRREGTEAVPTEREVLKWIGAAAREVAVAADGLGGARERLDRFDRGSDHEHARHYRERLTNALRALDDGREALDFVRGRAVAARG